MFWIFLFGTYAFIFSVLFSFFSKKAYQNHLNPLKRVRETFRTMNTIEIGQSVGFFFLEKGGGGWKSFFKKCKRERRVALFPKRKYYHL